MTHSSAPIRRSSVLFLLSLDTLIILATAIIYIQNEPTTFGRTGSATLSLVLFGLPALVATLVGWIALPKTESHNQLLRNTRDWITVAISIVVVIGIFLAGHDYAQYGDDHQQKYCNGTPVKSYNDLACNPSNDY